MKRNQVLSIIAIITISINYSFIKLRKPKIQYAIVVGIGKKEILCSDKLTVEKAVVFQFAQTSASNDYSSVANAIKNKMLNEEQISGDKIFIDYSYKKCAVIIGYEKRVPGWGCTATTYKAGFGDTYEDAKKDAIRSKNLYDSTPSWSEVGHFSQ